MDLVVKKALIDRVNTHKLAWAAGLFDGEGSCMTIQQKDRLNPTLCLSVTQSDDVVLNRFKDAVLDLGKISGPYRYKKSPLNWKPVFKWNLRNFEEAQAVIAMLWTFLSEPKKTQIKQALDSYHSTWHQSVWHINRAS